MNNSYYNDVRNNYYNSNIRNSLNNLNNLITGIHNNDDVVITEYNIQSYLIRLELESSDETIDNNHYLNKLYYKFFCFQLLKMNSILFYLTAGRKHPTLMKLCYISSILLNELHAMKPSILINQINSEMPSKLLKKNATFNIEYIYEESAYIINLMMFMNVGYVSYYRNKISFLPPEIWFLISNFYGSAFTIPSRIPFTINNRTDFYLEYLLFEVLYYKKKTIKRLVVPETDYNYLDYIYTDYVGETLLMNNRYKKAYNHYVKLNQKLYSNNLYYNNITDNIEDIFN
jgi:hypothetical protein